MSSHDERHHKVSHKLPVTDRAFCKYVLDIGHDAEGQNGKTIQLGRIQFKDAQGNYVEYINFHINSDRCYGNESYRNLNNPQKGVLNANYYAPIFSYL